MLGAVQSKENCLCKDLEVVMNKEYANVPVASRARSFTVKE